MSWVGGILYSWCKCVGIKAWVWHHQTSTALCLFMDLRELICLFMDPEAFICFFLWIFGHLFVQEQIGTISPCICPLKGVKVYYCGDEKHRGKMLMHTFVYSWILRHLFVYSWILGIYLFIYGSLGIYLFIYGPWDIYLFTYEFSMIYLFIYGPWDTYLFIYGSWDIYLFIHFSFKLEAFCVRKISMYFQRNIIQLCITYEA